MGDNSKFKWKRHKNEGDVVQGRQILGKEAWFRLHQLTMGLALLLSLVGVVPLLVDRDGNPSSSSSVVFSLSSN